VDVSLVIRQRLDELGLEQKDLARAANVTESYVSQLLTRKRTPPAPNRSEIYERMDKFLRLPTGELARLAGIQRQEGLKRALEGETAPLFPEVRELVLRRCEPDDAEHVRAIFQRQPFGELERLVTQKLLDVVKRVARPDLDTDIFHLSAEQCVAVLDPSIESWSIDLASFRLDIILSQRVAPGRPVWRFEFLQQDGDALTAEEPGLKEFRRDAALSGGATEEELAFLGRLRFKGRRPTALYYYRELQSLRDPLHFRQP
jgi:transcriptional regulator with XRE-family HTH domain